MARVPMDDFQEGEEIVRVYLAAKVAEVWGATVDDVAALTTANVKRLFGLP